MTRYRSKIGIGLVLPLYTVLIGVTFVMYYNAIWPGLVFMLCVTAFVTHLLLTTYYRIEKDILEIHSGFLFRKRISISKITKIQESQVALSAPATSLKRLEITYNVSDSILISPKNRKGFIGELCRINPAIDVRFRI